MTMQIILIVILIGFDIAVNDDQNGGTRDGYSVWFGDVNNATSTAKFGDLNLGL